MANAKANAALTLAAALVACTTFSPVQPSVQTYLDGLKGHPIEEITAKLGPPASQQLVGAEHWFTWTDDHVAPGFVAGQPLHGQCRFSVRTEDTGKILAWQWQGNAVGCQALFRPLR